MKTHAQVMRRAGLLLHKRIDGGMLAKALGLRAYKPDGVLQAFPRLARLLRPQVDARLLEPLSKLVAQCAGLIALTSGALPERALNPQLFLEHAYLVRGFEPPACLVERPEQQQVHRTARKTKHDEQDIRGYRQLITCRARQGEGYQADLA